jgi:hypothetical protein
MRWTASCIQSEACTPLLKSYSFIGRRSCARNCPQSWLGRYMWGSVCTEYCVANYQRGPDLRVTPSGQPNTMIVGRWSNSMVTLVEIITWTRRIARVSCWLKEESCHVCESLLSQQSNKCIVHNCNQSCLCAINVFTFLSLLDSRFTQLLLWMFVLSWRF